MLANHKGEIPFLALLIPFVVGIAIGHRFGNISLVYLLSAGSFLALIFFVLNFSYNRFGLYKSTWIGGLVINLLLLITGWGLTITYNDLSNNDHYSRQKAQYLAGYISNEPQTKNDIIRFTLQITETKSGKELKKVKGSLLVSIKDTKAKNLTYGQQLLILATYNTPAPPYNPGEFNYKAYLANKNIYHQIFLYPGQYALLNNTKGNPVIAYALQLRQNLVKKLQANMRDTNAIAVASTLVLGYKADLSDDIVQAYSKTGTIHILSVSGGHVAIIYLMLTWLLSFLNRYKHGRLIRAVSIIILIWGYALLTGFSPAVCRAALMLSLIVTGKTYSRYINSLNILAVSAFALLLYNPFLLFDVGFQLSYLAVAGLIVFQPIIYKWLVFDNKHLRKIWMACSISLAATAITFPLCAYYFHQFPVYFLISNLLIIIPIEIIMYTGILLLLLPQITWLSQALGWLLEKSIQFTNKMLIAIEHAPFANISGIWFTAAEYFFLFVATVLLFYTVYSKKSWSLKAALGCLLLFGLSIGYHKFNANEQQSITFLNLRKNMAIVFKYGSKGVVISNLNNNDKNFRYSVQPCIDSMQIANYKIYSPADSIHLPYLIKRGGLIHFINKKVLLLNRQSKIQSIPANFNDYYIYVSDNCYLDGHRGHTIIDGSNSDKHIEQLKNALADYYILKRNKSFSITSNK